jgi:hypothetical protein
MNCIGIETFSGTPVKLTFDAAISAIEPVSDSGGLYLAPGFVDLQVNGFLGVDFNDPNCTPEQIARSIRGLIATGVTRFYPTVITGSPADMLCALRNLKSAKETLREGVAIDGFHVEGPHISPDDGPRGAHPLRWVRRQPDSHRHPGPRVAAVAPLHRSRHRRRSGGQHRPYQRHHAAARRCRQRRRDALHAPG